MKNMVNDEMMDLAADLTRAYALSEKLSASEAARYFHNVLASLNGAAVAHGVNAANDKGVATGGRKRGLSNASQAAAEKNAAPTPAVPIETSVQPDFIVCLEDGERYRVLTRPLANRYGLTPEQYRRKWGLPKDYPMTAPNCSRLKSERAKERGFGTRNRRQLRAVTS